LLASMSATRRWMWSKSLPACASGIGSELSP
jgi:hypothetical protein